MVSVAEVPEMVYSCLEEREHALTGNRWGILLMQAGFYHYITWLREWDCPGSSHHLPATCLGQVVTISRHT